MNRIGALTLLVSTLAVCNAHGQSGSTKISIARVGVTSLAKDSARLHVSVAIRTRELKQGELPPALRGEMTAVNAIEDIEIRVNDQSVIVPFDAYCRIFNPHRAWLEVQSSKMTLSIEGGDAATYHRTMLHFDTRRVKRKTSWDVLGIAMNTTYYLRAVDEPGIAPDGNRLHPGK